MPIGGDEQAVFCITMAEGGVIFANPAHCPMVVLDEYYCTCRRNTRKMSNDSVERIRAYVVYKSRLPVALQADTKWIIEHRLELAVGHRSREILQGRAKLLKWPNYFFTFFRQSSIDRK